MLELADQARLEIVCAEMHRGFESHPFRLQSKRGAAARRPFCSARRNGGSDRHRCFFLFLGLSPLFRHPLVILLQGHHRAFLRKVHVQDAIEMVDLV